MSHVLIVSTTHDREGCLVREKLQKRGAKVSWLDYAAYPHRAEIGVTLKNTTPQVLLHIDAQRIECSTLSFLWIHKIPAIVSADPELSLVANLHIELESKHFLMALPDLLPHVFCYLPYHKVLSTSLKPPQLLKAAQAGLIVPFTYVGNSSDDADKFLNAVEGDVALKAAHCVGLPSVQYVHYLPFLERALASVGTISQEDTSTLLNSIQQQHARDLTFAFTRRVGPASLMNSLPQIRNSPVTLQQYVHKACDVRVTVIGEEIFPCAIYSQEIPEAVSDFRAAGAMNRMKHEPIELPESVSSGIQRFMKAMDLEFGCLDFALDKDGAFYFLELNPGGQWLWIEELTGLKISDALVEWILSK